MTSEYWSDDATGLTALAFEQPFPGGWSTQRFVWGTSTGPAPETIMVRLIAHALLNMLPERGLLEAFESLTRMRTYYAAEESQPLPQLETKRIRPKLSGRVETPSFQIEAE